MHLIIKDKYLKKLKNFVYVINSSVRKKNENLLIKCLEEDNKRKLIIYLSSDIFKIKFFLSEEDNNLEIKKSGQAIVSISFFYSLLNSLKDNNNLEIYEAESNYLQFFSGKFRCDLSLLENIDFEDIEVKGNKIDISYEILKSVYTKLKDFCKNPDSNIEKNTVLTNIHLQKNKDENSLEVYSSDLYRTVYGKFDFCNDYEFEVNLPPFILNLILELLGDYSNEDVEIWLNSGEFICQKNEYLLSTKLNMSNYPDLIRWFNEEGKYVFDVSREELICALDRNLLFSDKSIKTTSYRLEEGKLHVEYKESEKGSCKEVLNVNYSSSEKIEFSVNSFLLKGLLKGIDAEEVRFSISDPLKPIIIFDSGRDSNFQQFILPLRHD